MRQKLTYIFEEQRKLTGAQGGRGRAAREKLGEADRSRWVR